MTPETLARSTMEFWIVSRAAVAARRVVGAVDGYTARRLAVYAIHGTPAMRAAARSTMRAAGIMVVPSVLPPRRPLIETPGPDGAA